MNKISLHCPHFPACSGCSLSEDLGAPPVLQEMRSFFQKQDFKEFPIHTGSPEGWRCRAKLAVRGTSEAPIIGLYQRGTHHPIAIPHCLVHHPSINQAVALLCRFIQREGIQPYDETTHQGELRYVQLAVERATGKVQLALVVNHEKQAQSNWSKLTREGSWHSLWLNYNTRRDNVIFGKEWELLEGEELLWETICGRSICFIRQLCPSKPRSV